MKILGISAYYHDSAACLIDEGEIVAAAQEERFTRKKHDAGFPLNAARYCLAEAGVTDGQLDAIAFYDKPILKFHRILETYFSVAPRGIVPYLRALPIWLKNKPTLTASPVTTRDDNNALRPRAIIGLPPSHRLHREAAALPLDRNCPDRSRTGR